MAAELPRNRVELSLDELAHITDGKVAGPGAARVRGIVTDTRGPIEGGLFVALRGARFDGHDFASRAAELGAAALLVERDVPFPVPCVRVASTLGALGALGQHFRRRWGGKLIAVAGSAGKTTTRAAISALLESVEPGSVAYQPGNFNNAIGVPLVLLSLSSLQRLAVVEIGTNAPGEVAGLARLAEPDAGVLTLIGYEHTEGLGDLDGVEREEGALFAALPSGGLAVGNLDDERVARQLAGAARRTVSYGQSEHADFRFSVLGLSESGTELELVSRGDMPRRFRTELLGAAGAYAACAAVAVTESLLERRFPAELLSRAFSLPIVHESGRLRPITLADGGLLLDDSYNSNPESLESSLRAARAIADARSSSLLLVLGEMRELGALSEALHRRCGELAAEAAPRWLLAISGDARHLGEAARSRGVAADFASDAETAADLLLSRLEAGDVVLVKASRGVQAEKVVQRVVMARGRAA
jgi:UDP-N-acetylmuramoyl-tripeptide--D-alanyl-D-alanine ligase